MNGCYSGTFSNPVWTTDTDFDRQVSSELIRMHNCDYWNVQCFSYLPSVLNVKCSKIYYVFCWQIIFQGSDLIESVLEKVKYTSLGQNALHKW